jgi:hypothetical protein
MTHAATNGRTRCAAVGTLFPAALLALLAMALAPAATANGAEPYGEPWKIEEDWELVVNDPDPITNSPQITFFTCPDATNETCYFQLQMNYAADAGYSSGGFHVAAALDEELVDQARSQTRRTITVDGDRIRWTSVMAVINGEFLYAVKDGHGDDWGAFGGPDYLVRMTSSGEDDLGDYTPAKSLELVDVCFGGNRVASIVLKRVRVYFPDGDWVTIDVNASP